MDLTDLKDILRMLEEQEITEFELEQDGVKLRICRSRGAETSAAVVPSATATPPTAPPAAASAAAASAPAAPPEAAEPAAAPTPSGTRIESPIVGTFYRSPDPKSPPFVNVGDRVEVGQVLCIIEAMKLMNEIEAEIAGEVLEIHPDNGQAVQYGDPLFTIRPA